MDSVVRPAASGAWEVFSTDGIVLGAIEKRPDGHVVVPVPTSPLGDMEPIPYASLDAAMAAIGAHCQGRCDMDDA